MPRYLIVRRFDVSEDEMPEVGRRSRRTIEESYPEITWEHSHVVVDGDGAVLTYCIYDAPDEPMSSSLCGRVSTMNSVRSTPRIVHASATQFAYLTG